MRFRLRLHGFEVKDDAKTDPTFGDDPVWLALQQQIQRDAVTRGEG